MRKMFALGALLVAAAAANGCISTTMYGCEITETLAPGASEGAPDRARPIRRRAASHSLTPSRSPSVRAYQ